MPWRWTPERFDHAYAIVMGSVRLRQAAGGRWSRTAQFFAPLVPCLPHCLCHALLPPTPPPAVTKYCTHHIKQPLIVLH